VTGPTKVPDEESLGPVTGDGAGRSARTDSRLGANRAHQVV
jgi:hypothetical protein